MRGIAVVTTLSLHQQDTMVSALSVLLLTLNKSPARRSPEDHQVHTHAYLCLNKAQSCFMLSLFVFVCSSLDVCSKTHS